MSNPLFLELDLLWLLTDWPHTSIVILIDDMNKPVMKALISELEIELTKLTRAFQKLRRSNKELRKQQAVFEMEQTVLQDKYNEAHLHIINLTTQLGSLGHEHE
jgi:hypothetical protein